MSLFNGTLRPPAILSDEAVERYLAAVRAEIEVDPLFRRRLRGQVMNQYVAARESGVEAAPRRAMGKLGRAVLYASFALAATTTSVLAASQEAVPGDALYGLKRQVERLRAEVLPEQFQNQLAAYELTERIQELSTLAERGDTARVAILAAIVERDYEAFVAASGDAALAAEDPQLVVITGLLAALPEPVQDAIEDARRNGPGWSPGQASEPPGGNSGVGPPVAGANLDHDDDVDADQDPEEQDSATASEPTPKPAKTQKPAPTPEPQPTLAPTPDPVATPAPTNNGARHGAENGISGDESSDAQGEDD